MPYPDLYPPATNSPRMKLAASIGPLDTVIMIDDASKLPRPPNLLTIGTEEDAETVKLVAVAGNSIAVERGREGVAKAWGAGEYIARNFTAEDHRSIIAHLDQLRAEVFNLTGTLAWNWDSYLGNAYLSPEEMEVS